MDQIDCHFSSYLGIRMLYGYFLPFHSEKEDTAEGKTVDQLKVRHYEVALSFSAGASLLLLSVDNGPSGSEGFEF